MGRCVACGARSSLSNKIKTCSFPKNEERRNSWIRAFNKPNWMPTNNSVLCEVNYLLLFSLHFIDYIIYIDIASSMINIKTIN